MNKTLRFTSISLLILSALLISLQGFAQEALPPVENVRVENGAIVWEAPENIQAIIGNSRLVYNIYRAGSRNAIFVATVSDALEFRPSLSDNYIVIASLFGARFSAIDEATVVSFSINNIARPELTTLSNYEIRTNRCTDLAAGESCNVTCGGNLRLPAGGACRADGPVIVHSRARHDGYECLTTEDTLFVEVDVFCHAR